MRKLMLASTFSSLMLGSAMAQTCPNGGCFVPYTASSVSNGVITLTNANGTPTTLNTGSAAALTAAQAAQAAAVPVPATVAAGRALAAGDCPNSILTYTGTGAGAFTVPTGLTGGCQIRLIQATAANNGGTAAGQITVTAGSGMLVDVPSAVNSAGTSAPANQTSAPGAGLTVVIESGGTSYHLANSAA